jgi:hypothetical protein
LVDQHDVDIARAGCPHRDVAEGPTDDHEADAGPPRHAREGLEGLGMTERAQPTTWVGVMRAGIVRGVSQEIHGAERSTSGFYWVNGSTGRPIPHQRVVT